MNKSSALQVCATCGLAFFCELQASETASAAVTFSIHPINVIAVNANPPPLIIPAIPPGDQGAVCEASTSAFAITTNMSSQSITACLDSDMPLGLTLHLKMQAPPGATSEGSVLMDTDDRVLVRGLSNLNASNLTVRYSLHATMEAYGVAATRTIIYTIIP